MAGIATGIVYLIGGVTGGTLAGIWGDRIVLRRKDGRNIATLLIDGEPAGGFDESHGFISFISWSGLDIGRDRSSPVSHYAAPFAFTGKLRKVTMTMDDDQALDAEAAATAALARE